MPQQLIVYISEYAGTLEDVDRQLANIRETSKRFNQDNQISGVLFFLNNRFMQVLEGETKALEKLLEKIEADPRHTRLTYLLRVPISERQLADWNMDTFNLAKTEAFRPETLQAITRIYLANVEPDAQSFLAMLGELLNDPEMLRIVNA
jgi:hypothetical protein